MDREDVERVIDSDIPLQDVDREEAEDAGAETNQNRGGRIYEPSARGDRNQTRDRTGPNPSRLGCPWRSQEAVIQASPPIAAAVLVTTSAFTASPFAPRALPPLNPNQPNQRRPAPSTV